MTVGDRTNPLTALSEAFPAEGDTPAAAFLVPSRVENLKTIIQYVLVPDPPLLPVVLGPSGMGKSFLARQAELALRGNAELLDAIDLTRYSLGTENAFETFWIACSPGADRVVSSPVQTIGSALRKRYEELGETRPRNESMEKTYEVQAALSPKLGYKRTVKSDKAGAYDNEEVTKLATSLSERVGRVLVVLVDDLHRTEHGTELAELIRFVTGSRTPMRFLLVGTANQVGALVPYTWQIGSYVKAVEVPEWGADELTSIVNGGLTRLRESGVAPTVSKDITTAVVTIAGGSPALAVQLIRDAILRAERDDAERVTRRHLDRAVAALVRDLRTTS